MTTREQIIAAAKEAGFPEWENTDDPEFLKVIEKLYVVAFQSGAASRDAEVARLKTVPMRYRRMAFNAQLQDEVARLEQENDQLRAQINVLREALEYCVTQVGELATVPGIASALASTPKQPLAEYRNKVIEDCAITIENCEPDEHGRLSIQEIAEAVSAMKEQP